MIIALSGKYGSGKDTVGEILIDEYNFTRVAFADSLKFFLQKYFMISEEELEIKSPHIRKIMQGVGEFARNEFNLNYWINNTFETIRYLIIDNRDIVVTDLRYENELIALKNLGVPILFVRINSPRTINNTHISEIELDNYEDWDYIFENNNDLYSFRYTVSEFFAKLMRKYK